MGNVTVFVIFLIFIIAYVVLGNIKVKENGEISKKLTSMPEFDLKEEEESVKNAVDPTNKKRLIEDFEKRFLNKRSDSKIRNIPPKKEPILNEKGYNVHPEHYNQRRRNSCMENFSLKKAVIYSEILNRKF